MERVEFSLGSSRIFRVLGGILYFGAGVILLSSPFFFFVKLLSLAFLGYGYWRVYTHHLTRTAQASITRVWQDPKGQWGCQTQRGHSAVGRLIGESFSSPWFLVLCVRFPRRSLSVFIPVDAMTATQYRLLRLRLSLA